MNHLTERRGQPGTPKGSSTTPAAAAAAGQDRRTYDRHQVEGVQGTFLFSTDAKVVNLSLNGLAVETSSYLQVGRDYSLRLQHPKHPMRVHGEVVWCTLVRTRRDQRGDVVPVYRAGLRFEEILSEQATDLYGFIEKSAVIRVTGRISGRVRIQPPESADVEHEARFQLRHISQSGMGIESDFVPGLDSVVHIEMRLRRKKFVASGRLVHMRQLEERKADETRVLIGIEFLDLEERYQQVLGNFIRAQLS